MERFAVGRRQTYYELFKACRLCGSGGGYKMPIVQGAPTPNDTEPELRHKIRDCCSIDVNTDDKMPPLICELCVDKVNDFYEFREMCRSTNSRVRASLGLPPQTFNQESSAEDCILGVSGPLIYNSKELELSQSMQQKPIKLKVSLKEKKVEPAPLPPPEKRSLRKDVTKTNSQSLLAERLSNSKRRRGSESSSPAAPIKKLRFSDLPSTPIPSRSVEKRSASVSEPASKKLKEPPPKKIAPSNVCDVCKASFSKPFALKQHLIAQHTVNITPDKYGCAPCREWFISTKLAEEHHKWHRGSSTFYRCNRCSAEFKVLQGYTRHFAMKQCIPEEEVPDVICSVCKLPFITKTLMDQHKCTGPPFLGGHCGKCKKHFVKRLQLKRHENKCKGVYISPDVNPNNPHLKTLKPVQITMPKCDTLLERIKKEPMDDGSDQPVYNVSGLHGEGVLVKSEPPEDGFNDGPGYDMDIKQEIKEEYPDYNSDCGDTGFGDNYSSDGSVSDTETSHTPNLVFNPFARKNTTQVESLSFISLRSIFSNKMFKRKNKQKKRLPKIEKTEANNMFDDLLENPGDNSKSSDKEIVESLQENCTVDNDITNEDGALPNNQISITSNENCLHNSENEISTLSGEVSSSVGEEAIDPEITANKIDTSHLSSLISDEDCIQVDNVDQSTSLELNICDDNLKSMITNENVSIENVMDQIIVAAVEGSCNFAESEDSPIGKDIVNSETEMNNESISIEKKSDSLSDLVETTSDTNSTIVITNVASESKIIESSDDALQLKTNESTENEVHFEENEKNANHEIETDTNFELESGVLQAGPLLSNKSLDESKISHENDEAVTNIKMDLPQSVIQCNYTNDNDMPNLINRPTDDTDIDFDIDSMLQSDLGPLAMKKHNEMMSNRQANLFSMKASLPKTISEEATTNKNALDTGESSPSETLTNSNIDKINDLGHTNDEKVHISVISTTPNNPVKESSDLPSEPDIVNERSENDVLDLVSDSGDDCNIIDSPEKLKALEDQLLADDVDDININQVENISSTISHDDEKILLKNSSVNSCETNVKDFEVTDSFSLFSNDEENAISSCSKKSDIENNLDSEEKINLDDKIDSFSNFTNNIEADKLIGDIDTDKLTDSMEMDTLTDNIDMEKLPDDMAVDKLMDNNIQI
ncbi:uncharacterized protein LOC143923075 [Arctopsyche grandis]|uniref:uncharacterized protein LOC143923075 n=1 Tax=Arctopsyche grandis TaxID=121162 RepID=UPI00406D6FEE